ncbi:hypothetical protein QLQ12_36040 [Actinoplanes sp. NEAU-A12]|uniref:AAA+ ATPase domain-containing protein n=1 Tax=Actinoplanes sandaracinus TaxID=3045177 RepID=A0ABT6WWM4_9ACTN|nr:hypothetical protein [Actinoplanes sandaracinus]MDI6104015.1 hypothetical protein [Actinoplanes sandaracinus]
MSDIGHLPEGIAAANPFMSVALGSHYDPEGVTIPTKAIQDASTTVGEYLTLPGPGQGHVLAVIGDHGMGKTYLARHVLSLVKRQPDLQIRTMYLVARDQTFVELYQDFAEELLVQSPREIPNLVRRIYARIVADSLRESELTARLATELDSGNLDPVDVVERYGLRESRYHRELQQRLEAVTDNPEFGVAFALLLRPAFEPSVREWLRGHTPDPLLRERGIQQTLDTETRALEAMGVFTLLYSHAGFKFLLVVDELEQILRRRDRPDTAVLSAFQQLLEVFVQAGGFLMLAGVPEAISSLTPAVRGRIGQPIVMKPFTGDDVATFFKTARPGLSEPDALAPFTPATAAYLAELVGGNPRAVVMLGYKLVQAARGVDVTPAMVREAVREHFNFDVLRSVNREVASTVSASGWPYEVGLRVGQPSVLVDYWISIGDEGAHCAVLIADSILGDEDARRLRDAAATISAEPGPTEVILVVSGVLPPRWVPELAQAFGRNPLAYDRTSFGDDFQIAFKAAVDRLGPLGRIGAEDTVSHSRIARQQANMYRLLGQTANRLEGLRAQSDRQWATVSQVLADLAATAPARLPDVTAVLPAEVEALFTRADEALHLTVDTESVIRRAFGLGTDASQFPSTANQLGQTVIQRAAGTGWLLRTMLSAFREAVGQWYAEALNREPTSEQWESLDGHCETFALLYEQLPVLSVEALRDFTGPVERQPPTVSDAMGALGSRVRRKLRSQFEPRG